MNALHATLCSMQVCNECLHATLCSLQVYNECLNTAYFAVSSSKEVGREVLNDTHKLSNVEI